MTVCRGAQPQSLTVGRLQQQQDRKIFSISRTLGPGLSQPAKHNQIDVWEISAVVQLSFSLIGCVHIFCISVILNTFVTINILILNKSSISCWNRIKFISMFRFNTEWNYQPHENIENPWGTQNSNSKTSKIIRKATFCWASKFYINFW